MRKGEQPLVMMKMEVKIRVIVVVTTAAVDVMMMAVAPIVITTVVEVMIAHIVEMIGVHPLVIDEDADLFYEEYDNDVDYYDEDIEDDAEANKWSDTNSDQYKLINVLENAREENAQAIKCIMMNIPMGIFQIGVISLMLVQGLALGMISMEEKFQNWGRIMIQNQVRQPYILKRRMT